MNYKDLYDAVDKMDDFTDDYYSTKADNKYLSKENDILKDDNDLLVGEIRNLNRVARRRYRYSNEDKNIQQRDNGCSQQNSNKPVDNNKCCLFNFNFTNIIICVGVLFLVFFSIRCNTRNYYILGVNKGYVDRIYM